MNTFRFSLAILLQFLAANVTVAQRVLPESVQSSTALLILSNGSLGSGFYINNGTNAYLITAKHVILGHSTNRVAESLIARSCDRSFQATNVITLEMNLDALEKSGCLRLHKIRDVAAILVVSFSSGKTNATGDRIGSLSQGIKATIPPNSVLVGLDMTNSTTLAGVVIASDALMSGYPASLGLPNEPSLDLHKPLFRKGIIAGVNDSIHKIIIDCPSYGGNSGGPVFQILDKVFEKDFRVVGIITEFIPYAEHWTNDRVNLVQTFYYNSGLAVAEPMDFALELMY